MPELAKHSMKKGGGPFWMTLRNSREYFLRVRLDGGQPFSDRDIARLFSRLQGGGLSEHKVARILGMPVAIVKDIVGRTT